MAEIFTAAWWQPHLVSLADWAITSGLRIVAILIVLWIGTRLARAFIARGVRLAVRTREESAVHTLMVTKRQTTLIKLFQAVASVALLIVAIVMIFDELGIAIAPILASAGIVGVAVGFGAQSLVKDIISGAFIILESQFSVGDVVKVDDLAGGVEEINLRTIVLRGADGGVHIIPNGEISRVTGLTRDWSRLVLDIDVAYDADLAKASLTLERILQDYAAEHADIVLEAPEVLGVESLGESSVQLRAWMKVLPGKQWPAGRELRARIKSAFDQAGIEIPFPSEDTLAQKSSHTGIHLLPRVTLPSCLNFFL